MKKIVLGCAALMMTAFSLSVSAQDNAAAICDDNCATAQNVCADNDCVKDAKCKYCPYAGLNLTELQQGQIKALDEAVKSTKKEIKKEAAEARKSGAKDSLLRTNLRKYNVELRTKYIDDLGKILDSEQYVTFLRNYYINTPRDKKAFDKKAGDRKIGDKKSGDRKGRIDKKALKLDRRGGDKQAKLRASDK